MIFQGFLSSSFQLISAIILFILLIKINLRDNIQYLIFH